MRKRRAKNLHIYLKLLTIIIILSVLVSYAQKMIFPYIVEISESRIRETVTTAVNDAVNAETGGVHYNDMVSITRDNDGRILSIETDIVRMNRIAAQISAAVYNSLSSRGGGRIVVPAGVLFGNTFLAGSGPKLHISVMPSGGVETSFKSDFSSAGINQTRHRIDLQVITSVGIAVPLIGKKYEVDMDVPITETIIVGEVPQTYMGK